MPCPIFRLHRPDKPASGRRGFQETITQILQKRTQKEFRFEHRMAEQPLCDKAHV